MNRHFRPFSQETSTGSSWWCHIPYGCRVGRYGYPYKIWWFKVEPFLIFRSRSLCDGRRTTADAGHHINQNAIRRSSWKWNSFFITVKGNRLSHNFKPKVVGVAGFMRLILFSKPGIWRWRLSPLRRRLTFAAPKGARLLIYYTYAHVVGWVGPCQWWKKERSK